MASFTRYASFQCWEVLDKREHPDFGILKPRYFLPGSCGDITVVFEFLYLRQVEQASLREGELSIAITREQKSTNFSKGYDALFCDFSKSFFETPFYDKNSALWSAETITSCYLYKSVVKNFEPDRGRQKDGRLQQYFILDRSLGPGKSFAFLKQIFTDPIALYASYCGRALVQRLAGKFLAQAYILRKSSAILDKAGRRSNRFVSLPRLQ